MKRRAFIRAFVGLALAPAALIKPKALEQPRIGPIPKRRSKRAGWYAWSERGFAVLDNRRVILGKF